MTSPKRKEVKQEKTVGEQTNPAELRLAEFEQALFQSGRLGSGGEAEAIPEIAWQKEFGDRVPSSWRNWSEIKDSFEKADDLSLQLSDSLLEAGLAHPNWRVAHTIGKRQSLNRQQFQLLKNHSDLPPWALEEVVGVQKYRFFRSYG